MGSGGGGVDQVIKAMVDGVDVCVNPGCVWMMDGDRRRVCVVVVDGLLVGWLGSDVWMIIVVYSPPTCLPHTLHTHTTAPHTAHTTTHTLSYIFPTSPATTLPTTYCTHYSYTHTHLHTPPSACTHTPHYLPTYST